MAVYKYTVVTKDGQRLSGERASESKDEVLNYLHEKNYTIVSLDEKLAVDFNKLLSGDIGGIPLKEKVVIAKQLSTMISAGIPLIQAIDILVQQTEKPALKAQLQEIYKSIESGSTLSDALRKQAGIFSEVHMSLIAAGEKSANLNEMLEKIAIDLEKSRNIRGKITGALIYPAIIFIALGVVFVLMVTTMIPQVKELYKTLGQDELPFITEFLVQVGSAFTNPFGIALFVIIIIAAFATYKYAQTTSNGKHAIDKFKINVPIFGQLIRKFELVQFCRLTSMLLKSGVQIIETMTIVQKTSGNKIYGDIVKKSIDELTKGTGLAMAIAKYNEAEAFPIILVKIMATGEETGKIDSILEDMGAFYEAELEQLSNNLTKVMEPLIMLIAGGMVAFMAIAVYLPIFQVGQFVQ